MHTLCFATAFCLVHHLIKTSHQTLRGKQACPACVDMTPTQQYQRTINSQKELIEITWLPLCVPEDLIHNRGCLHKVIQEYQATVDRPNDDRCDNLMRQGFSLQNSYAEAWWSTQGRSIRNKAILTCNPSTHRRISYQQANVRYGSKMSALFHYRQHQRQENNCLIQQFPSVTKVRPPFQMSHAKQEPASRLYQIRWVQEIANSYVDQQQ